MNSKNHVILLIDGNHMNIFSLTRLLNDFNIVSETTGTRGIEKAKGIKPDLILLDINLPDMSGFDAIKMLKDDTATQNIPVIFIAEKSDAQDEELAFTTGAVDYICKPFSSYILKHRIEAQLKLFAQERRLKELIIFDQLTGLTIRKHFTDILDNEWRRATRSQLPLGVALISANNFHTYKERHGHSAANKVLVHLAGVIKNKIRRAGDQAAVWSEDAFALCLYNMQLEGVRTVVKGICDAFASIDEHGLAASLTISAGIHSVIPVLDNDDNISRVMLDVGMALEHAKQTGGNKIAALSDIACRGQR